MKTKETTKLISILALTTLISGSGLLAAVNVNIGGGTGNNNASNYSNWTTNSTLAYNWENVTRNDASRHVNNQWNLSILTDTNYTVGRGFLFNRTFDLSLSQNGLEDITIFSDFWGYNRQNWRIIMVVNNVQYQYNEVGNYFNGSAHKYFYNLHQSSNWVSINNTGVAGINDTLGVEMTPGLLQGTTGIVQFGFMYWAGSSSGSLSGTAQTDVVSVNDFEVDITYTEAVPEPATFALLLGSAGLCFVMIRRRRKSLDS
jgi:hypothetical protein